MLLSIIIPAYNSEKTIKKLIDRLNKVKIKGVAKEIIVVDDCSRDKTPQIVKKIKGLKLISHKKNTGKGGALRSGFENAKGDILFVLDDDLEYDPLEIPLLVQPILDKKTEVVFGSRYLEGSSHSSLVYYWGGKLIDWAVRVMLRCDLADALTASKMFTRRIYDSIRPIESKGFEVEQEITAKIVKMGIKPLEVAITYTPRTHAQGKNVRWHHAFPMLKALFKYSF